MTTTIANVIDRVYREFLWPPSEQPTRFAVDSGGISDSATTLPVDVSLLSPEETDLIGPGLVIEVGSELMLVEGTNDPPSSLTVRRGMFGTTGAEHSAGDLAYVAPDFPRQKVFEAVADTIESLWPDLWTNTVTEVWTHGGPIEVPAAVGEVTDVRAQHGNGWVQLTGWDLMVGFPHSSTGMALQVGDSLNCPLHVYYRKIPQRPTTESDTISDLGVQEGWVKVIAVGATAMAIAGEDLDRATIEFITESLASEGFPAGSGADLRNALLQYQGFLVGPLRRGLERAMPQRVMVDRSF